MRAEAVLPRQLAELLGGGTETLPSPVPVPEAQALELLRRFDAMQQICDLKPRDLLVEKSGVGALDEDKKDDLVFVFVRELDPTQVGDRQMIENSVRSTTVDSVDCLVAYLKDGQFRFLAHSKAMLTHWTGALPA